MAIVWENFHAASTLVGKVKIPDRTYCQHSEMWQILCCSLNDGIRCCLIHICRLVIEMWTLESITTTVMAPLLLLWALHHCLSPEAAAGGAAAVTDNKWASKLRYRELWVVTADCSLEHRRREPLFFLPSFTEMAEGILILNIYFTCSLHAAVFSKCLL